MGNSKYSKCDKQKTRVDQWMHNSARSAYNEVLTEFGVPTHVSNVVGGRATWKKEDLPDYLQFLDDVVVKDIPIEHLCKDIHDDHIYIGIFLPLADSAKMALRGFPNLQLTNVGDNSVVNCKIAIRCRSVNHCLTIFAQVLRILCGSLNVRDVNKSNMIDVALNHVQNDDMDAREQLIEEILVGLRMYNVRGFRGLPHTSDMVREQSGTAGHFDIMAADSIESACLVHDNGTIARPVSESYVQLPNMPTTSAIGMTNGQLEAIGDNFIEGFTSPLTYIPPTERLMYNYYGSIEGFAPSTASIEQKIASADQLVRKLMMTPSERDKYVKSLLGGIRTWTKPRESYMINPDEGKFDCVNGACHTYGQHPLPFSGARVSKASCPASFELVTRGVNKPQKEGLCPKNIERLEELAQEMRGL